MKRKVLIIVLVIMVLILLKLGYSYIVNNILIGKYETGQYDEDLAKTLTILNFPERLYSQL